MRLYLSSHSYETESLSAFYGPRPKIGLIANALDFLPRAARADAVDSMLNSLRELGDVTEIDLRYFFSRPYVGRPKGLREKLGALDALWLPGGSCFLLAAALKYSLATQIVAALVRGGAINYAGSSAGAVVTAASLLPATTCEDPEIVNQCYRENPVYNGLGLLSAVVIPHFIEEPSKGALPTYLMRDYCRADGTDYVTITDGSALVIDEAQTTELVFPAQETSPAPAI